MTSPFWSDHKGILMRLSLKPVLGKKAATEAAEATEAAAAVVAEVAASASDDVNATPAADIMEETTVGVSAEVAPAPALTPAEETAAEEKVVEEKVVEEKAAALAAVALAVEAVAAEEKAAEEKAAAAVCEGGFFTLLASLWSNMVQRADKKEEAKAGGNEEATVAAAAVVAVSMEVGIDGMVVLTVELAAPPPEEVAVPEEGAVGEATQQVVQQAVQQQQKEEEEEEEEEEEAQVCGTLRKRGARFPYAWQSRHVAFLASRGTVCYFKEPASEKGRFSRADPPQAETPQAEVSQMAEPQDGIREGEAEQQPPTPSPASPAPRRAAMEPRGALVLTALRPNLKDGTALAFVGSDGRVMLAKAPSAAEAQRWLEALSSFVPALMEPEVAAAAEVDASAPVCAPTAPPSPGSKPLVVDYEAVMYTPKAQTEAAAEAAAEAAMEEAPTGAVAEPEESVVAQSI